MASIRWGSWLTNCDPHRRQGVSPQVPCKWPLDEASRFHKLRWWEALWELWQLTNWASEFHFNWLINQYQYQFPGSLLEDWCRDSILRSHVPDHWPGSDTMTKSMAWYQVPEVQVLVLTLDIWPTLCPWPSLRRGVETNWGDEGRRLSVYTSGLKCQLHQTQTQWHFR